MSGRPSQPFETSMCRTHVLLLLCHCITVTLVCIQTLNSSDPGVNLWLSLRVALFCCLCQVFSIVDLEEQEKKINNLCIMFVIIGVVAGVSMMLMVRPRP